MAGPEDAVMMILRNIQAELADVKRSFGASLERLESSVRNLSERMDSFEGYFTYQMGLTSRNQMDIKKLQADVRALTDRVTQLEPQT